MPCKSALAGPTLVLMTVATLMLQLALYERQGFVLHAWIQLALVLGVGVAIGRSDRWSNRKSGNTVAAIGFTVVAVLPFLTDVLQRANSPFGNPFEVQLVLCLRNLMICLGARSQDSRSLVFASLTSGFLTLFSFLWLLNRWTIALVFAYAIIGMWWLMGAYWDRLSGSFLTRSERRIPWKPILGAAILGVVALLASLPFAGGKNYTAAIRGFLPSSGGTGGQDKFAFGGVGDGPQMVSAKESASGFGPIESELFLESKMPTLYDAMNEFAEPPPKPKKRGRQRAIPLAPGQMQQNHQRRGVNQRAEREFNTVRRQKQETRKLEDLRSHALLHVVGRVPIHLGLYAYDTWDGQQLISSDSAEEFTLSLERDAAEERNWARLIGSTPDDCLTHQDRHEVRIINLKTERVPAPPNLSAVHIDKLHTEKLFQSTPDGMLAMDMERIPQLSILHIRSLQRHASQTPQPIKEDSHALSENDSIASRAHRWTDGVKEGWPKVEAVCARLRQEYTHDPKAMVPEDTDDAAEYFLSEARRGPDYLFATSAALLLRSLGYETRVVSGFYADPKNYNRQSRITSVYADNAHFWVEVLASSQVRGDDGSVLYTRNYWVTVDPTPGYEVLLAPESLWTQLFSRAALTWHALKRNPLRSLGMIAILALAWQRRAYLFDILVTTWWLLVHRWGDVRHRVNTTIRLLERRARVHGCPRAKGVSLSKWSENLASRQAAADSWQAHFIELANWALYGEGIPSKYSEQEANKLCKEAALIKLFPTQSHHYGFAFIKRKST